MPCRTMGYGSADVGVDCRALVSFGTLTFSVEAQTKVCAFTIHVSLDGVRRRVLLYGDIKER